MRKYNTNKLVEIKCNKCGKEMLVEDGIVKEGVFATEYNWGYFSNKDGQKHMFDLCEECYEDIINDFKIQVDKKENIELI